MIFLVVGALRIASTYTTFSEGIDEPIHLAAGLELLTKHEYKVQPANPPLPRLFFAIGPWLDGVRIDSFDTRIYSHPGFVFQSGRGYRRTLALARVGNLIFFILAALATWSWARREAGEAAGVAAMFLFTTQPIVLGYSGLVTHDTAAMAGVAVSILAFLRWLERPNTLRALLLGAAYGFAIACKFSCVGYVPAACGALLLVRSIHERRAGREWKPAVATILVAPLATALVIWASYGFSIGQPADVGGVIARMHIRGPVPAPKFIEGLVRLALINRAGMPSYLFGDMRTTGWWWYFPTALALKTTLAFLALVVIGFFAARSRVFLESVAAAAAMMAVAMSSPLDLGVRYVLPVFVPLSVAGGEALMTLLDQKRTALRVVAIVLVCWHAGASVFAHPDYFPYFNELAGKDPSRYLVDSNLDWGQDILRLVKVARQLNIQRLGVDIFANADLDALHLPPRYRPDAHSPASGWIAVSDHAYRMEGWNWLEGRPYRRVGKSIRLYFIASPR
jgi:4-amino-4-deoxy-L-arabinose transferase-like glycosyltransferase